MTTPKHQISFAPYRPEYLDVIDLLPDEAEIVREGADFLQELSRRPFDWRAPHFCGAAFIDSALLYIGGYYTTEPGVVQVFIIPDKRALRHPIAFYRTVLLWRGIVESRIGVSRMETFSLLTGRICKWMRRCGFTCEGETTRYTKSGGRFMLWSRSKKDGVWGR